MGVPAAGPELDRLLLAAVCEVASKPFRNRRANPPALIVPIRELLETGADPNAVDGQGKDAFQLLGELVETRANAAALTVARTLIDHGYALVDRRGLDHLRGELAAGVMMHLANRARRGRLDMGVDGDTYLHGLAERQAGTLVMFLAKDAGQPPSKHLVPSQLLRRGRESDGATPVHLLWRTPVGEGEAGQAREDVLWQATRLMVRYKGLYLALADGQGRWVLDEIRDRLHASGNGMPTTDDEEMAVFLAQVEASMLERRTVAAPNVRSGRAIRL